ncbi:MAG TPA: hypothetical protein DEP37_01070 [Algoriphagus sp.]|nr:hypothetical protein [Algoriphagus sp.]
MKRDQLNEAVERYLKSGGKITRLPEFTDKTLESLQINTEQSDSENLKELQDDGVLPVLN